MKISIITATYNSASTIVETLDSLNEQTYDNIEHIIIDGGSTDNTLELVKAYGKRVSIVISEKDEGIYDALNKGISVATGDIIGILHSDDMFAYIDAVSDIAKVFFDNTVDACYGDLSYISRSGDNRVVRTWIAGDYSESKYKYGWMPPHTTFYMKNALYKKLGGYDTTLKIAADYDAMLRYTLVAKINIVYIPKILIYMKVGGGSTRLSQKFESLKDELIVMKRYNLGGVMTFMKKKIYKLPQFFKIVK